MVLIPKPIAANPTGPVRPVAAAAIVATPARINPCSTGCSLAKARYFCSASLVLLSAPPMAFKISPWILSNAVSKPCTGPVFSNHFHKSSYFFLSPLMASAPLPKKVRLLDGSAEPSAVFRPFAAPSATDLKILSISRADS